MDPSLLYCSQLGTHQRAHDQRNRRKENNPYISQKDANRYTQNSENALKWFKTGKVIEIDLSRQGSIATQKELTVSPLSKKDEVQDAGFVLKTPNKEGAVGYESAAGQAERYMWKQGYEAEILALFGSSGFFATEESLLFANIDAIVAFTQRKGGFIGRSEIKAYRAFLCGSLGLPASGYYLWGIRKNSFCLGEYD